MAGHSKWSKVKHSKGPLDGKHGAAFGTRVKESTVLARGRLAAGSVLYMFDEMGTATAPRLFCDRATAGPLDD